MKSLEQALSVSALSPISDINGSGAPKIFMRSVKSRLTGLSWLPQPDLALDLYLIREPDEYPQPVTTLYRILTTLRLNAEPADPMSPSLSNTLSASLTKNL